MPVLEGSSASLDDLSYCTPVILSLAWPLEEEAAELLLVEATVVKGIVEWYKGLRLVGTIVGTCWLVWFKWTFVLLCKVCGSCTRVASIAFGWLAVLGP